MARAGVETVGERPGKRANRWNFNVVRADGANDAATTLALNSLESSAERDLWVGAAQRALNPQPPMSAADPLEPTSYAGPSGQQLQGPGHVTNFIVLQDSNQSKYG